VVWTRSDTLHGSKGDSAIVVRGQVRNDSILLSAPSPTVLSVPTIPWAVADFGMEEQLIPLFRSMAVVSQAQPVALLRPYHIRWDTISVLVRDNGGLRMAVTLGRDRAREAWIIDENGRLLYVRRVDQQGDRIPLPTSDAYNEMRERSATIRALLQPYPAPNNPSR
jgi:hypothetical protein